MMMSDKEIKDLLNYITLSDDQASFKKIYLYFYKRLFWFAKTLVKVDEVAEEIIDDVFLSVWQQRAKLTEIDNFAGYCYVSVKNKCLTHLSKLQHDIINIDDVHIEIPDTAYTAEDRIAGDDMKIAIDNALNRLSDQCKLVFKLVKHDGLKYREVAGLLNISTKTVEYHMGNSLKHIVIAITNSKNPKKKLSYK